jgi:hypothetical protein
MDNVGHVEFRYSAGSKFWARKGCKLESETWVDTLNDFSVAEDIAIVFEVSNAYYLIDEA